MLSDLPFPFPSGSDTPRSTSVMLLCRSWGVDFPKSETGELPEDEGDLASAGCTVDSFEGVDEATRWSRAFSARALK